MSETTIERLERLAAEALLQGKAVEALRLSEGMKAYSTVTHTGQVPWFCGVSVRCGLPCDAISAESILRLNAERMVSPSLIRSPGFTPSWRPDCLHTPAAKERGERLGNPAVLLYQTGGRGFRCNELKFWIQIRAAEELFAEVKVEDVHWPVSWLVNARIERYDQHTGDPVEFYSREPSGLKGGNLYRVGRGHWHYYRYWDSIESFVTDYNNPVIP